MVVKVSFHPSGWCFLTAWICNNKVNLSRPRGQDSHRRGAPDCRTVRKVKSVIFGLIETMLTKKKFKDFFEKYERYKQKPRLAEF